MRQIRLKSMKGWFTAALFALSPLITPAFGAEQAGPNPANLSPAGSHGVSLFTGAFTYSYPIEVPPGRR